MSEDGEKPKTSGSSEKLTQTDLLGDIELPTEGTLRSGLEQMGKMFIIHSWRLHRGEHEDNPELRMRLEEQTSREAYILDNLGQEPFVKKVKEAISKGKFNPSSE